MSADHASPPPEGPPAGGPGAPPVAEELVDLLSQKVVGQASATRYIVPYVRMYQAGLAPDGRPVGVFLLLGPTGTGKTRTVEALAEALHGSARHFIKVDCGEFQMDHEVAKLIGAPPGYLGHRETVPILTQRRLAEVTSEGCDLALILFDEIEKAAPALTQLLLGVLDKATLRLGDNSTVNFEKSIIFLTSNLGAREMMSELGPGFGFTPAVARARAEVASKLENIALAAVRRRFSPEFINRIDAVVTYEPLDTVALGKILDQQIEELQEHVNTRLGPRCFTIEVSEDSRRFLLEKGTSAEYGARELKRTLHRHLTQPLAALVAAGRIEPGARVRVEPGADGASLTMQTVPAPAAAPAHPTVLIVDDNRDLLLYLEELLAKPAWTTVVAETAGQALEAVRERPPTVALLDYLLPDRNGVQLGAELRARFPGIRVIITSGLDLPPEDESVCEREGFAFLRKPFLEEQVMSMLRGGLARRRGGAA